LQWNPILDQVTDFFDSLEDSEEFKERLLLHIEALNDKEKAVITGRLFKALVQNKIEIKEFKRMLVLLKVHTLMIFLRCTSNGRNLVCPLDISKHQVLKAH